LAFNVGLDCEQPTCKAVTAWGLDARCSHIQGLALRATKCAGGNVLHRHFNNSIDVPVGGDTHDTSTVETAIPKVSFCVDARTVRITLGKTREKGPPICDGAAGRVVVVNPDNILQRVAEIELSAVRAPSKRVGNAEIATPLCDRVV